MLCLTAIYTVVAFEQLPLAGPLSVFLPVTTRSRRRAFVIKDSVIVDCERTLEWKPDMGDSCKLCDFSVVCLLRRVLLEVPFNAPCWLSTAQL
ncbi:hypothetical protein R3P38DRAFT_2904679 [Favolaschia claudopus]|uniref:Secreted protein n=1 Tax=Favolaschia claudopus TaxID=2862362 RepID=A0AAW0CEQ1_9AGAR